MNNNKKRVSFLLALVLALSFVKVEAAHVLDRTDSVPWDEPEKDLPAKRPEEPVVVKKPKTFWETLQGWVGKKPKKAVNTDEPFVAPDQNPLVEVAGTPTDGPDDVQDTAADKAAILRAANRGFTFFSRPTLKNEEEKTLTSAQEILLKNLIAKCEADPKYPLDHHDMDDFPKDELKLVEKIFNTAKEQAARNKKAAQPELAKFKKEQENGLSKVEVKILKLLLADPVNQPTSFSDEGIAAYKNRIQDLVAAAKEIILTIADGQYHSGKHPQMVAADYARDLAVRYKGNSAAQEVLEVLRSDEELSRDAFNNQALTLARYSDEAAEKADLSSSEESIMRGVLKKDDVGGKLLLDLGSDGYKKRVDDIISAVKLMKATLSKFKGRDVQPKGKTDKGVMLYEEDRVTVAQLQKAFDKAVANLPEGSDKAAFLEIGKKIVNSFQSGKVPGAHWASFRLKAGLSVDIVNVDPKVAPKE